MSLPSFKYHPDPLATGSIKHSDAKCICCGSARGYIYVGPVYAEEELDSSLCPWCIADGSAHQKYDAEFTDEAGVGGGGLWDEVAEEIIDQVAHKTPGFSGWQQEKWWTHCHDAAAFMGRAGRVELEAAGTDAIEAIQDSTGLSSGGQWNEFFNALDREGSPTAYLFRCVHCGKLGGYQDCD